jgi:hypothetical protein
MQQNTVNIKMRAMINCRFILAFLLFLSSPEITHASYPVKIDAAKVGASIHQADAPKKKNKLAQWSLILAAGGFLLTFVPVVSILSPFMLVGGVVTGFIALGQIRKSRQKGSGLAIAGLIIGGVSILIAFAAFVVLLSLFN